MSSLGRARYTGPKRKRVPVVRVVSKKKQDAKSVAFRALRISRGVALSRETKFYSKTERDSINPVSGVQYLPCTYLGGNGVILRPLEGLALGTSAQSRIGERIKVKHIDITVMIDSFSTATSEFKLDGAFYQFVIFQVMSEPSNDANFPSSIAGRYWDTNSVGQVLDPATSTFNAWAMKALDSRRYNTKTIIRKCGVLKPSNNVSDDNAGAFVRATANKHNIFRGRIRLPKPMITYRNDLLLTNINDVVCLLLLDTRTSAVPSDFFHASSVVTFTDS